MSFAFIDSAATTGITGVNQSRKNVLVNWVAMDFFGRIFDFCWFDLKAAAQKRSLLVNKDSNVPPNRSPAVKAMPLSTRCNFSNFVFTGRKIPNFQQMGWDETRQDGRPDGEAFHSPAPNKHSNTSVKSNNFTINEIPICLQCISHWHFPHCNRALIKFLKCKNASKRLKTSPGVSVPGRGLWYLIFIAVCPGHRKPEC